MLILLAILIFIYNLGFSLLLLQHGEPSFLAHLLYQALFISGFGAWLHRDLRQQRIEPVYCSGLFLQVGWMFVVPYYLYKTRKLKAFVPIGILVGSFILSQVIAIICYVIATV